MLKTLLVLSGAIDQIDGDVVAIDVDTPNLLVVPTSLLPPGLGEGSTVSVVLCGPHGRPLAELTPLSLPLAVSPRCRAEVRRTLTIPREKPT